MKLKLNFIFLLIILFAGCVQPEKKDILEISPEYFVDQEITLSDIADDIEYIPLSSETFFPFILSPQLTDSLIIFNGGQKKGILEYSRDGSFIREIGSNGRGPGEYKYGHNISIDDKNQKIYIIDQGKFLVYDFKGNLIREKTTSAYNDFSKILYQDNKLYLFATLSDNEYFNSPDYWVILDTLENKLSSKKNTTTGFPDSKSAQITTSNLAYKFDNKIFYWNHYNDTVFELQGTSYKAAYLFKHDEYRLTPEITGNRENFGQNNHYIIYHLFESQHYIFIHYRQNRKTQFCIYNKHEDKFINCTSQQNQKVGLINDIDGGMPFPLEEIVKLENGEFLISSINAFELKEYVASDDFKSSTPKYPEKKKQLEQLANSLDENDNPVLILVKLKD